MARVDTLIYGAEGEARRRWANLEWQVRLAPVNRPRLQPRATKDLRPLRVLYGPPSAVAQDPEQAPDYPLRDAKPANDGNLYVQLKTTAAAPLD